MSFAKRHPKDSAELARLASWDSGQEVMPDDVRNYFVAGERALERFTPDDRREIIATLLSEMVS